MLQTRASPAILNFPKVHNTYAQKSIETSLRSSTARFFRSRRESRPSLHLFEHVSFVFTFPSRNVWIIVDCAIPNIYHRNKYVLFPLLLQICIPAITT